MQTTQMIGGNVGLLMEAAAKDRRAAQSDVWREVLAAVRAKTKKADLEALCIQMIAELSE